MPISLSLKVSGTDKLAKEFKRLGKKGKITFSEITKISANEIEAQAKKNVPKDTGKLSQSIKSEKIKELTYRVTAYENYAPFVEYGTRFQDAQPYLEPAFKKIKPRYIKDLNEQLNRLKKEF